MAGNKILEIIFILLLFEFREGSRKSQKSKVDSSFKTPPSPLFQLSPFFNPNMSPETNYLNLLWIFVNIWNLPYYVMSTWQEHQFS